MNAKLSWVDKMQFKCNNHGHELTIDATPEHGGQDLGPSPKELVLNAMMGCTAMDVVSILKKMRQEIISFKMDIDAEKNLEHPVHFKTAILRFHLEGPIDEEKAIRAVDSSLTKYCGVNYMISKTCEITYELFLNKKSIKIGSANFN